MENQPETIEQSATESPVEAPTRTPILSRGEALFVFLACMLLGFVGVLVGFVPLVAIAMIGPVVVAFLV